MSNVHAQTEAPSAVAFDSPETSIHRLRVLKFGSSVLSRPEDAATLASEIYAHVRHGRKVVAVVSALAGETDRLLRDAPAPPPPSAAAGSASVPRGPPPPRRNAQRDRGTVEG